MMANEWMRISTTLWDSPRISKLCDETSCGEAQVIGGLYWLWSTAVKYSKDGIIRGLSVREIDRKTGINGFGDAICGVGYIADHPEGVRVIFDVVDI